MTCACAAPLASAPSLILYLHTRLSALHCCGLSALHGRGLRATHGLHPACPPVQPPTAAPYSQQNVFETLIGKKQQLMLATQVCKMILKVRGAAEWHGISRGVDV